MISEHSANLSPRGRRRKEAGQRLLQKGLELMAEKGIDACRVEDITRAAGLAKGTFFTHFPGKDAMVARLAGHLLAELAGRVGQVGLMPLDAQSLLAAVGAVHWRFFQLNPQAASFLGQACGLAHANQEVRAFWENYLDALGQKLAPAGERLGWPRERARELALLLVSSSLGFFWLGRSLGLAEDIPPELAERLGRIPAQALGPA